MKREDRITRGAVYLVVGEIMLVIMASFVKQLKTEAPFPVIIFFRNGFGLLTLIPYLIITQTPLKTNQTKWHLVRTLSGLTAMYGYFYVIHHMPLAEATMVKLTTPIFLPIIAYLWLKESVKFYHIWAIFIGFIGVGFIVRPTIEGVTIVAIIALLAAFLQGVAKVTIRKMALTEPHGRVIFYFALFSTIISLIPAVIYWETPHAGKIWLHLFLMGASGTLGQIFMTKAYQIASPGKIGAFTYTELIFSVTIGWLFFSEQIVFPTLIGFGLIILAGFINLRMKKTTD